MNESGESLRLPSWAEQMRALEQVGDNLIAKWRPDGASIAETQDMNKLALSILACGYLCHVYTDSRRPVFMPLWNYAFNQGGPNPDFVYSNAEIDPNGVYQISGYRGTTRFVEITQRKDNLMTESQVELLDDSPLTLTLDLDDLQLDENGYFSTLLSAERPEGYGGDWWFLDPRAHGLLMRRCSCDWNREVDAGVAINRLDDGGSDMPAEEIARRFSNMAVWIEGMIGYDTKLVRYYRQHHGINTLLHSNRIGSTESGELGGVIKQAYYDGIHQIDDDEALIVETALPRTCRYWQILVADDRFSTVDWVNRQSSLNDVQARIDGDGKLRAVVSRRDPGVPNWLDKADFPWGIIQMRFNHASDFPDATVTKVPVADVQKHLPKDTPVVTAAERQEQLRVRREGAQLRRIW
jgi:hypothetical protein